MSPPDPFPHHVALADTTLRAPISSVFPSRDTTSPVARAVLSRTVKGSSTLAPIELYDQNESTTKYCDDFVWSSARHVNCFSQHLGQHLIQSSPPNTNPTSRRRNRSRTTQLYSHQHRFRPRDDVKLSSRFQEGQSPTLRDEYKLSSHFQGRTIANTAAPRDEPKLSSRIQEGFVRPRQDVLKLPSHGIPIRHIASSTDRIDRLDFRIPFSTTPTSATSSPQHHLTTSPPHPHRLTLNTLRPFDHIASHPHDPHTITNSDPHDPHQPSTLRPHGRQRPKHVS